MTDNERERSDAAFCADLVRSSDFERYASTLFVDAESRRAMLAIFAFNVEIARVRGQVEQALAGEIRLQWWTDCLAGNPHGDAAANPVAAELLRAMARSDIHAEALLRLIEAHRFDLYEDPMVSTQELDAYLDATSGALFGLAAQCLSPGQVFPHNVAREAGRAFGLVRIIEILGLTSSRGQLYVPLEWLEHSGVAAQDIFSGRQTPELRSLLDDCCRRVRSHLKAAMEGLSSAPAARAFLPLALLDARLRTIEHAAFQPFMPMQPRSSLATLWTLWRASRRRPFQG